MLRGPEHWRSNATYIVVVGEGVWGMNMEQFAWSVIMHEYEHVEGGHPDNPPPTNPDGSLTQGR